MNKKLVAALVTTGLCLSEVAAASPITDFHKGQGSVDLGAWDMKGKVGGHTLGTKWNLQGGITYGLAEKIGLGYEYHGLHAGDFRHGDVSGNEHEINAYYTLDPQIAMFVGWHRIHASIDRDSEYNGGTTNNIAQLGFVGKTPLSEKFDLYGKVAGGSKSTWLGEAGVAYNINKDFDANLGYRYLKTEMHGDSNKYKGVYLGVTYKFGGPAEETNNVMEETELQPVEPQGPVVSNTPTPTTTPVAEATVPANDYYFNSVHFDTDKDTIRADQVAIVDQFVNTAKQTGHTFKLVGNTDSQGNATYNDDLSRRRVNAIAQYAKDHGVPPTQLVTMFKGQANPTETNNTDAGRAANRRVDLFEHK